MTNQPEPLAVAAHDVLTTLGLTFSAKPSNRKPPADFANSSAWSCTFRKPATGQRLTVPFYMGSGHAGKAPTALSVLSCLSSDASGASGEFADFCGNYGYSADSIKAERLFNACRRIDAGLRSLLGADYVRVLYGDLQEAIWEA